MQMAWTRSLDLPELGHCRCSEPGKTPERGEYAPSVEDEPDTSTSAAPDLDSGSRLSTQLRSHADAPEPASGPWSLAGGSVHGFPPRPQSKPVPFERGKGLNYAEGEVRLKRPAGARLRRAYQDRGRRRWATDEGWEVDFLATGPGRKPLLLQVCASAADSAVLERESRALENAGAAHPSARVQLLTRTMRRPGA